MIYDAFLFNGEHDVLEIRLATLANVVERFILVEANVAFNGSPLTPTFAGSELAKKYDDKIIRVLVDDVPNTGPDNWARERFIRNAIVRGLGSTHSDDLVVVSDADEIPDPVKLAEQVPGAFRCQVSRFWLNTVEKDDYWFGSVMLHSFYVKAYGAEHLRTHRFDYNHIDPGGWHFTHIMSENQIREKLRIGSHSEWSSKEQQEEVLRCRKNLTAFHAHHHKLTVTDIATGYFPQYLKDNVARFQQFIHARENA